MAARRPHAEPSHRAARPAVSLVIRCAAGVALAAGAACTGNLNSEPGLVGTTPLPALEPDTAPTVRTDDAPSLVGLDRRNWPVQRIVSPPGQVETNPTYVDDPFADQTLPRQRGDYPTLATMLDETGSGSEQALDAALSIPYAGYLLVASPFKMILVAPPNAVVRDDPTDYARMPAPPSTDPWVWVTPQPGATPLPVAPVLESDGSAGAGGGTP